MCNSFHVLLRADAFVFCLFYVGEVLCVLKWQLAESSPSSVCVRAHTHTHTHGHTHSRWVNCSVS